jgi:sugar phosphate isomerase/epimerase
MLDLGFVSAILGEKSLEEVIVFAGQNDFKCVEVMCWPSNNGDTRRYAGVSHIDVDNLTSERVAGIQQLLLENQIYISALGYYPNPLDEDEQMAEFFRDHIMKVISASALLKIPVVNTFIGRNPKKNIKDNLELFSSHWPKIIQHAEACNIKIGIENCPMFFTNDEWPGGKNLAISPAIWDRMFELIPSEALGLNYDPSHMIWQRMDEISPILDYRHKLHHIHLKDAKVYKEKLDKVGIMANPLEYHSPKIPGRGDVNWNDFFAALEEVKYTGPVVIEVEDKDFEGSEQDIVNAILASRDYIMPYLKQY